MAPLNLKYNKDINVIWCINLQLSLYKESLMCSKLCEVLFCVL